MNFLYNIPLKILPCRSPPPPSTLVSAQTGALGEQLCRREKAKSLGRGAKVQYLEHKFQTGEIPVLLQLQHGQ